MSSSRERFLDQALDGYRAGARAWSRDALLSGLVLLFAGVFVVAPFLSWSGQSRAVEGERARVGTGHERVVAAERAVDDLQGALAGAQVAAATTANQLAAELSDRLRRFAALARSLQPGGAPPPPELLPPPPGAMPLPAPPAAQPNFPGAAMAQQFTLPPAPLPGLSVPPVLAEPSTVLEDEFGLAPSDLEQFRQAFAAGPGTPAWEDASATSARLFKAEIERTYAQLERAVGARLAELRATLTKGLGELATRAPEFGLTLPHAEQLLPPATVVRLPSEDELFRTVGGKAEAFSQVGLYQVNLNLDAASAPLHAAAGLLAAAAADLDGRRAELEQRRAEIDRQLHELDDRLKTIRSELGGLGAPLQWLAIDTGSFVRLYPTLLALAAVWLALRYRRLDDLRARLDAGYRDLGIEERDIRLALYIPDAALGRLQEAPEGIGGALRWLRPTLAAGLALGLGLITAWLQLTSGQPSLAWVVPPLMLGLAAGALILHRPKPIG